MTLPATARAIGHFPPGYWENLPSRAKGPLAAMMFSALGVSGPPIKEISLSPKGARRRLDDFYSRLYPERLMRFERLLRWTGLTPIARASDVTLDAILHGCSFGCSSVTLSTDGDLAESLVIALDEGQKSLARY
jgi:hypothetical protein